MKIGKPVRIVLWVLGVLTLLVLSVGIGLRMFLKSDYLREKIDSLAAEYIDADLSYESLRLSLLKDFPRVSVGADALALTYPHERFGVYVTSDGPESAGRGSERDTLASVSSLDVSINVLKLLRGQYDIASVTIGRPKLFLHQFSQEDVNWDVLTLPEDDPQDTSSFDFSTLTLHSLRVPDSLELVFTTPFDAIRAGVDLLEASGAGKEYDVDVCAHIAMDLAEYGHLEVPFSLCTVVDFDGAVKVNGLELEFGGLTAQLDAAVEDAFGEDPAFEIDLDASLDVLKMVNTLRLDDEFTAGGKLTAHLQGAARLSQMSIYNFSSSSISGWVKGGSIFFEMPSSDIFLTAGNPVISLAPSAQAGGRLMLRADADSLCIKGFGLHADASGVKFTATNEPQQISDGLYPVIADLYAKRADVELAEGMDLSLRESRNEFTIIKEDGRPHLDITTDNSLVYFTSEELSLNASDVMLSAGAMMLEKQSRSERLAGRGQSQGRRMSADESFSGSDVDFHLTGTAAEYLREWSPHGSIAIGSADVTTPYLPLENRVFDLEGDFDGDELRLESFNATSGSSSLKAGGSLSGLRSALLRKGRLNLDFKIDAERINADELLAALKSNLLARSGEAVADTADERMPLVVIPSNVVMDFDIDADRVDYSDLRIGKFTTCVRMQNRILRITDTELESNMGGIALDAFYSTISKDDISAGLDLRLRDITSENVIKLIPQIDTMVPLLKSFKGHLNTDFAVTMQLDTFMTPVLPSIEGVMNISGSELEVSGVDELRKLTRLLMFRNRKDVEIADISIDGVISGNKLEIMPFVMGVDRYTLVLKGVQNFDQSFDYHVSVLKSPIPFRFGVKLGGDFDNWKFRFTKSKYRNTRLPSVAEQLETMRSGLRSSIENIFDRGVRRTVRDHSRRMRNVEEAKEEILRQEAEVEATEESGFPDEEMEARLEEMAEEQESEEADQSEQEENNNNI